MDINEFETRAHQLVTDRTLGYDQKVRRLAALATDALPYPILSADCAEALSKRVICDMYEGNAPFTARYILPDYERPCATACGTSSWPRPPTSTTRCVPADHVRPRAQRDHLPRVPRRPRQGAGPVRRPTTITDDALDTKLRRFWIAIDRMLPDAFVHLDLGPHDSRITRSILRVERSLRQAVPNITLKVDPAITPDDLIATPCAPCSSPASRTSSTTR
jgi:hypothetical protein